MVLIIQIQLEVLKVREHLHYLLIQRVERVVQLVVPQVYGLDVRAWRHLTVEELLYLVLLKVYRTEARVIQEI